MNSFGGWRAAELGPHAILLVLEPRRSEAARNRSGSSLP